MDDGTRSQQPERAPITYATEPLTREHERSAFSSGSDALDRYIRQQATQDTRRNIAQVFVRSVPGTRTVIGYYSLSMTSISLHDLPGEMQRKLPRYPDVPAALIGRLAIDHTHQGVGLGTILLQDAMRRVHAASRSVAAFALIVDAKDQRAADFYKRHRFTPLDTNESRLLIPLDTIAKALYQG